MTTWKNGKRWVYSITHHEGCADPLKHELPLHTKRDAAPHPIRWEEAGRRPGEGHYSSVSGMAKLITHTFIGKPVQDFVHKCSNPSRLPDPHGSCTVAPPGCHRQPTVGSGRT